MAGDLISNARVVKPPQKPKKTVWMDCGLMNTWSFEERGVLGEVGASHPLLLYCPVSLSFIWPFLSYILSLEIGNLVK